MYHISLQATTLYKLGFIPICILPEYNKSIVNNLLYVQEAAFNELSNIIHKSLSTPEISTTDMKSIDTVQISVEFIWIHFLVK